MKAGVSGPAPPASRGPGPTPRIPLAGFDTQRLARGGDRERVLSPDTLSVQVRMESMGRKHFEMSYRVLSGEGALLARAWTTQVMYDYAEGRSMRVATELRERIEAFEGRELPLRRSGT